MKLPHTEVKFYSEAKSQTGLSSPRVSCKRALTLVKLTEVKLENVYMRPEVNSNRDKIKTYFRIKFHVGVSQLHSVFT